jgi:hypothetical protein
MLFIFSFVVFFFMIDALLEIVELKKRLEKHKSELKEAASQFEHPINASCKCRTK